VARPTKGYAANAHQCKWRVITETEGNFGDNAEILYFTKADVV